MEHPRPLTQTAVTRGELTRVLRSVATTCDPWQVAGRANVPFPQLLELMQRLQSDGTVALTDTAVYLTPAGLALARELGAWPTPELACAACQGSGVDLGVYGHVRQTLLELVRERPPAISSFDQGALTVDSVLRRIALMDAQGDVRGRRVILLGDDDLTGIALALTGLPRQIVVVEVDERLCGFIRAAARAHSLDLTLLQHDVRRPLPPEFHGAFDTFVTDPPETIQGLLLFVEKGLSMLAPGDGRAGYFGLTLIEASHHKWNLWERHLLQNHALVFTQVTAPFSLYDKDPAEFERGRASAMGAVPSPAPAGLGPYAHPAREPWYRSALFRVQTLGEFVPPPDYDANPRDELYQDAESMDEAWTRLAGLEPHSPVPLPSEFLEASRERAKQAAYGLGRHVIAEFWNCQNDFPLHGLEEAITRGVTQARATLLELNLRRFYPQGFSAIALLAESHLSIHAWPELGYVALDVFTCGAADPQVILNALESHFRPRETAYLRIPRGRVRQGDHWNSPA